jgi:hypothetical protein
MRKQNKRAALLSGAKSAAAIFFLPQISRITQMGK